MSPIRMPKSHSEPQHVDSGDAVLKFQLLEGLDGSVSRCERDLQSALSALERHRAEPDRAHRERLLDEAADIAWRLIVQHEACDVCDHHELIERYRIPSEVLARMGARH
ncbi:DUF6665 family protein [Phenylobacterium sp. J367]|uniref:DUF6665 family protein n=1 Tax=Phenylobacterium sp. J367 TaxID=2898435 RepID=UPI002150B465|nr:DUF6665 family protein [Phenylobacterium sp. J367]MCR5879014.1 hypothetical protein [Phenylobacterium sp. J367]